MADMCLEYNHFRGHILDSIYAAQSRTKCVSSFFKTVCKKYIVCWNKNYNEQFSGGEGMTPWGMKLGRDGQFIP